MKFLEKIKALAEEAKRRSRQSAQFFDAEVFNHPLANQTEWHPMAAGGSNFKTHRLDTLQPDKLIFKCTKGAYFFGGAFVFFGLLGIIIPLLVFINGEESWWLLFFAVIFGGIFSGVGALMLYLFSIPRVFDTFYNCYYKGHKKPDPMMGDKNKHATLIDLNKVKAVQVIKEHIRSNKSNYHSYEINLVLEDASRINVIDHGKHQAVIEDAEKLSQELGVPLWDGS